jgi:Tol biopolymer transport system component
MIPMTEYTKLIERLGERYGVPDLSTDQLLNRRDRKRRNQRITAGVVGIAVFVAAVWIVTSVGSFHNTRGPAVPGAPPSPTPAGIDLQELERTVGDVTFSFSAPITGWEVFEGYWEPKDAISINKSIVGPQGAEAMFFWTSFPYDERTDPCARLLPSGTDLAAAVATAPGTELVEGPSDVTVGGYPAKQVVLSVREDLGCDPGFFYTWDDPPGGALFPSTTVGDTIRVWIVHVDGTRLFLEAVTTEQADFDLEQEIDQIIGSIRFGDTPTTFPGAPQVDYVIDLNTGMMTPLPAAIIRSLGEDRPHTGGRFAASPDDSTLAYVAADDNGRFQVFVANLDGSGIRQVTYDPVEATSPAWSPDGMRIAYEGYSSGGARGLFVLDVATGEATKVIGVQKPGSSPTFTPDGSSIVYDGGTNQQPGLRIVPVTGGPSTLLVEPGGGILDSGNGSISPDGSLVTYLGGGFPESDEVEHCGPCRFVANTDGTGRRIIGGWMANPAGTWSPDSSRIVTGTGYPGGAIWVIDIATGERAEAARGRMAIWLNNHTLLVEV